MIVVFGVFVSLFLVPAWQTVFVHGSTGDRWDLGHLLVAVLSVCHDHFDSFEVFSTCSHPLHELQILSLHVFVALCKFISLERQLEDLLSGSPLSLRCLFPVALVHVESSFHLCGCGSHVSIVFMDRLDVFLVRLRFLLLIRPQVLDLSLILFFADSEVRYLRV